jgi:hypothetical protein
MADTVMACCASNPASTYTRIIRSSQSDWQSSYYLARDATDIGIPLHCSDSQQASSQAASCSTRHSRCHGHYLSARNLLQFLQPNRSYHSHSIGSTCRDHSLH